MGGVLGQREHKGTSYLPFRGRRLHALVHSPHFISENSEGPKTLSGLLRVAQPIEELGPGLGLLAYFFFFFPLLSGSKTSNWRCDYKERRHRTLDLSSVLEVWSIAGAKMEPWTYYYYTYNGFLDGINVVLSLCVGCIFFQLYLNDVPT